MNVEWIEMWRISNYGKFEKVRILPATADGQYVLVEGEEHTSYKGNFFANPLDALRAALDSCESSIRYNNQKIEELNRAYMRTIEKEKK